MSILGYKMDILPVVNCNSSVYINETIFNFTNISNETLGISRSQQVPDPPVYILVIATILYVLIFIVGLFGNILVVTVVMCSRNMKTPVNVYLVNLCVADILVLVVCMPTVLVELHTKEAWYFGEAMCKMVPFLEVVVAGASIFTIMAITIERYRVVYKPLNCKGINPYQVLKIILVIWILVGCISAPMFLIVRYKDSTFLDGTPVKVCRMPIKEEWQKSYIILMTIVVYVLPCFILFVLYFRVCRTLMSSKDRMDVCESAHHEKRRLKGQVINIIITVVVVFFICHLPYRVVSLWLIFENKFTIINLGLERYLNIVYSARILLYINHAMNPILYNFVSKKFRTAFWWLCKNKSKANARRDSRSVNRGIRVVDTVRPNKQTVTFRPAKTKKNNNCVRKNNATRSSSSSSSQRINDFSFIYKKLSQKEVYRDENVNQINSCKNAKTIFDERNDRVATVHLKVNSKEFYITMGLSDNNNSDEIRVPLTNLCA